MRTLSIILLCALLVGLCACGQIEQETTVAPTMGGSTEMPTTAIGLSKVEIPTDENDPYSFLVRDFYENSFSSSISSNNNYLEHIYFALQDIDGDGTEEMLWGQDCPDGEKTISNLYTIQDGTAVEQWELLRWLTEASEPQRILFKNGTIRIEGQSEIGTQLCRYLRFEEGELKLLVILRDEQGSYSKGFNERIPITREEYDRLRKEYEGDGQLAALDWKPLEEYGR